MKFTTKKARLLAITDAYCARFKKSSFTTEEVSEWAIANLLWPVPARGDALEICLAWERLLDVASKGGA